jgi:hypothetical protein
MVVSAGARSRPMVRSNAASIESLLFDPGVKKIPCQPSDEKPAGLLTGLRADAMPLELFQHSGDLYAK